MDLMTCILFMGETLEISSLPSHLYDTYMDTDRVSAHILRMRRSPKKREEKMGNNIKIGLRNVGRME
jgi:hypothetical protein